MMPETDIVKFAKDILGVELFPYQEDLLRRMEKGETVVFGMRAHGKRTLNRVWDEYLQFKKTSPLDVAPKCPRCGKPMVLKFYDTGIPPNRFGCDCEEGS